MEGKCPKCKTSYFGYALRNPRHQRCDRCGTPLEITEQGAKLHTGPHVPHLNITKFSAAIAKTA